MEHHAGFSENSMDLTAAEKTTLLAMFDESYGDFVAVGKVVGAEHLEALLQALGGQKPHVPTPENFWQQLRRAARDEEMRRKFKGHNQQELAIDYRMSERQVRRILAAPARERRKPEPVKSLKVSVAVYARVAMLAQRLNASARTVHNVLVDIALALPDLDERLRAAFGGQRDIFTDTDRTTDKAA